MGSNFGPCHDSQWNLGDFAYNCKVFFRRGHYESTVTHLLNEARDEISNFSFWIMTNSMSWRLYFPNNPGRGSFRINLSSISMFHPLWCNGHVSSENFTETVANHPWNTIPKYRFQISKYQTSLKCPNCPSWRNKSSIEQIVFH